MIRILKKLDFSKPIIQWAVLDLIAIAIYLIAKYFIQATNTVFLFFFILYLLNSALALVFYKTQDMVKLFILSLVLLEFSISWYYLTLYIAIQRG